VQKRSAEAHESSTRKSAVAEGPYVRVARVGKPAVGVALVVLGVLGVSGADKALEARVLDLMPAWLVDLTTRF